MGIRFNNREIGSLYANGHDIIEAMINGRIVWPEEEFHWQPNADMIWARSQWEALSSGRYGFLRMHYSKDLINDFFFEPGTFMTSDGATYEVTMDNMPIEHTWDFSNSRQSEVYRDTKVVWTICFPDSIDPYPMGIEYGETYYCFDGISIGWHNLLYCEIAYFDLLNNATPYFDSSWDGVAMGFFNGFSKLQALPKEFTFKLDCYRLQAIFSGCETLIAVPYLDIENAYSGMGMFDGLGTLRELGLVNINVSLDLSPCPSLTRSSLKNVIAGLIDRTEQTAYQIKFGGVNLAKLSQSDLQAVSAKNWEIVETVTDYPELNGG
ncbi:hypothetical protein Q5O14_08175 [Eubacteriaceae bacterium ES2]|nr:hypothetical protein Q5O14_08175 [Eubacteriaceae bacterium ES2]